MPLAPFFASKTLDKLERMCYFRAMPGPALFSFPLLSPLYSLPSFPGIVLNCLGLDRYFLMYFVELGLASCFLSPLLPGCLVTLSSVLYFLLSFPFLRTNTFPPLSGSRISKTGL